MSDNVSITEGDGTDVVAADDIAGVKHQRVKVEFGADGAATDVSASDPLPVEVIDSTLPTGAATSAKQDTGNTSLSSIDGKITAVNTGAVVVSSSALPAGAATAAKQPALGTAGSASADVITVQGKASMTPLLTDGSGVTQPVSGTVTINAVPAGTNLVGKVKISDGTDDATVRDVTGAKALDVSIVDASGNQITSFGGGSSGTQYTEGDTDSTITGSAILWEDAADTLSTVKASKPLPVGDGGGSLTVDGTVGVSGTVTVDSELTTADLDTGAGTDTRAVVGIAGTKSGGAALIPGDATAGLKVDLGADNDVTVTSGTVTANIGTAGSLALDATLTGGTQQTKITDGTQIANTIAGDTGQNVLLTAGARKEITFTTTTVQAVATTDVSNYRGVAIHITSQGSSSAITFQGSNDNSNWFSVALVIAAATTNGSSTTATTATGGFHGALNYRYFRLNVTGISAGTTAGTIDFLSIAPGQAVVSATQSGVWSVQPGNTANTTAWKVDASSVAVPITDNSGSLTVDQPTGTNLHTVIDGVTPGNGATQLGKAEDAAHTSGDTGVFVLGVRNDTRAALAGTDGDYIPLTTNSLGDLRTDPTAAMRATTPAQSSVAASASSASLLASNTARKGATITNDSSAVMYLKLGATASTTSYSVTLAGAAAAPFSYYEVPFGYTGAIDAIWASATGNARITELT